MAGGGGGGTTGRYREGSFPGPRRVPQLDLGDGYTSSSVHPSVHVSVWKSYFDF